MNKCFAFRSMGAIYWSIVPSYIHIPIVTQLGKRACNSLSRMQLTTLACWVDIFFADKESMEASFILHCGRSKDQAQQLYHRVST